MKVKSCFRSETWRQRSFQPTNWKRKTDKTNSVFWTQMQNVNVALDVYHADYPCTEPECLSRALYVTMLNIHWPIRKTKDPMVLISTFKILWQCLTEKKGRLRFIRILKAIQIKKRQPFIFVGSCLKPIYSKSLCFCPHF